MQKELPKLHPIQAVACSNGTDDDGDGWIDMADPSCEKTNGGSESG